MKPDTLMYLLFLKSVQYNNNKVNSDLVDLATVRKCFKS